MSDEEKKDSEGEDEGENAEIPSEEQKFTPKTKEGFENRYNELLAQGGLSRKEIAQTLYQEGFGTYAIMKAHLPIYGLKQQAVEAAKESESDGKLPPTSKVPLTTSSAHVQAALMGRVKGEGYLDELKDMIKYQISRSRELTEAFFNIGLSSTLAALYKSGMSLDDFNKVMAEAGTLRKALATAGETIFKALEAYNSDVLPRIEAERDEARFTAAQVEALYDDLQKKIEPMNKLENMIYKLAMLSGTSKVDPMVINELLDRWLTLQFPMTVTTEAG